MFQAVESQRSCARAWVAACETIVSTRDQGYNVVIDVQNASHHSDKDNEVIAMVDKFLRSHQKANPIITVSNTIFPQSLLVEHGREHFYEVYHRDFAKFSKTKNWGRYFERMTRHIDPNGKVINPLQELIDKMKASEQKKKCLKAAYEIAINPLDAVAEDLTETDYACEQLDSQEITIYQPSRDRNRRLGGPCLSYLSFKRHPEHGLLLTAMYRNHYYITRLLGNLIGLGRLQAFVAAETGVPIGSLTVISTHAELDTGDWGIVEAREVVATSRRILQGQLAE